MKIFLIFLGILLVLFLVLIFLGLLRTWQIQSKPQQKQFLEGQVPKELPNGFYKGSINAQTPWQGKKFDAKNSTGINVFKEGNKTKEAFPFKTYKGFGLQDKNLEVLKIDYSKSDPWWVRYVVDEIVEVAPGKYLGKAHIVLIPGFPITAGFFQLEKEVVVKKGPVTVKGTLVCLPHKNTSGSQTMECAYGLKDQKGVYYALRDTDPTYKNISGIPMNGIEVVAVTGVFTPEESDTYQSIGTIAVESIKL